MFLTWAHFWTKYQFASDMILGISQLLCQVLKHSVTKVDRHHPKSEVGIFYISMECLFPEICPFLWNILSPVTAAWLLPTKEGWSILLRLLRSPYSTVLPLSLQVLPLISHFCFFYRGQNQRLSLASPEPQAQKNFLFCWILLVWTMPFDGSEWPQQQHSNC